MVSMAAASPKVTAPGPLVLVHAVVKAAGGVGFASSVTVPLSVAFVGNGKFASTPALVSGPILDGFGVIVTLSMTVVPAVDGEPTIP